MQTLKQLLRKSSATTKTEFWALTTFFVFYIFFNLSGLNEKHIPFQTLFEKAHYPFDYLQHFFIPQLIRYVFVFLAFLYLNFLILPQLMMGYKLAKNISIFFFVFICCGFLLGFTNTYLNAYLFAGTGSNTINQELSRTGFLQALFLLSALAVYTIIKFIVLHILLNADAIYRSHPFFRPEGLRAIAVWIIGLTVLCLIGADGGFILIWTTIIPSSILVYLLNFHRFITQSLKLRYPLFQYAIRNLALMPLLVMVVEMKLTITKTDHIEPRGISQLNVIFQFFITVPVTWMLYKRSMSRMDEMNLLKKELNQSAANIDFLRSQINPHFLFNALNTIYGTALQENATRTSEGIERLGEMMRFMLTENLEDKIPLSREINYLNNYLTLQKLRTDTSPEINIETQIQEGAAGLQIAPMILIPFIENAFKHGISFREPSYIKANLAINNKCLYFDVKNSRHQRMDEDPEKDKSGIGLSNVQQRLSLVYPNLHQLNINETASEFSIHLELQLA